MQTDKCYKQLSFYNSCEYQYVYQTSSSVGQNDYLNCTSVYFYADKMLTKSFNSDCFMQLNQSKYTTEQPFKLINLNQNQIAISYNLSQAYGLNVGSKIYSKHNIKNTIQEYTVAQILPVCYGITIVDTEINRGVVVMGYDNYYKTNTNYTYIGFSKTDPSSKIINAQVGLISLNNKQSFAQNLTQKTVLWQTIIFVVVAIITTIFVVFHWKNQKNYYKRLYIYGFFTQKIKKQMFADVFIPAVVGLVFAFVFSITTISLFNKFFCYFTALISVSVGFLLVLVFSFIILKRGIKC